jgi:hypothetical protein
MLPVGLAIVARPRAWTKADWILAVLCLGMDSFDLDSGKRTLPGGSSVAKLIEEYLA